MPKQSVQLPPIYMPSGELSELYDHACRCTSERINKYVDAPDLRWAKLYNRALRTLFKQQWASEYVPTKITNFIIDAAVSNHFRVVIDLGGTTPDVVMDHNIRIVVPSFTFHQLEWAKYFGNYDWKRKTETASKAMRKIPFDLLDTEQGRVIRTVDTKQ